MASASATDHSSGERARLSIRLAAASRLRPPGAHTTDMANPRPRKRRRWWDRNLTIAVIAAVSAVVGAAVGGVASYLGNRALQNSQSEATAKGIARVLEAEFVDDEQRLTLSLQQRRILMPNSTSTIALSVDNEELLASNLSARSWADISTAMATISLEGSLFTNTSNPDILKARAGLQAPLTNGVLDLERSLLGELVAAVGALRPLAGT